MDRTLFCLLALSVVLIMGFAPHATVTLVVVLTLSAIATRIAWATLQSLGQSKHHQRVLD